MRKPALPENDSRRVETLHDLQILDTGPEERFDRLARIAKSHYDVPIALVGLVDANRQWFKSCLGLDVTETDRGISFCDHAILEDKVLCVEDALDATPVSMTTRWLPDRLTYVSTRARHSTRRTGWP